jgi:hypothetical protein
VYNELACQLVALDAPAWVYVLIDLAVAGNGCHLVHKATSEVASSTSHIEDRAWLISNQCDKLVDGLIRVRTPLMIDLDKAPLFELFCILQAKMAWFWLH